MFRDQNNIEITIDARKAKPLYIQIYDQLRESILAGDLPAGYKLPPSRELASQVGIGRVTVIRAYEQLQIEGFVISRRGAGTFVAGIVEAAPLSQAPQPFRPMLTPWGARVVAKGPAARRSKPRLEIDFGFGRSFPHIFPYKIWRRLLARYLSTDDIMLSQYGSVAGFLPLRHALADYLARQRGVRCSPEQVIIVSGAQQALDILARLVIEPGDQVLVESPGYRDAFTLFEVHGAQLRPLPVDDNGLPVEQFAEDFSARLAFVTPTHQFPKGGTLPLNRRLQLLAWANKQGALIIEDDYDGELRYDGYPLAALQGLDETGQVIYLGTFSKVLFPALKLGYVVLPQALITPFGRAKGLVDRGSPTLTQAAVADFIAEGHFERHLKRLRQAYGERRESLVQALETYLGSEATYSSQPAGLHIMLYLDQGFSEAQVVHKAAAKGVGVYPGHIYHLEKPAPPSILLGFSGLNEEQIIEGVRRLAAVMEELA